MRACRNTSTLLLITMLALCATGAAGQDPPEPTNLTSTEEVRRYAESAVSWLQSHPQDPRSPGVAYDLIIVGDWARNPNLVQAGRRALFFYFHNSPQAVHAARNMGGLEPYRRFVLEYLSSRMSEIPDQLPRQMLVAFDLGKLAYGEPAWSDPPLALAALMMAEQYRRSSPEAAARREAALQRIEQSARAASFPAEWQPVAAIVTDASLSPSERLLRLAELDASHADTLLNAAILALPADERMSRPVVTVRLIQALGGRRWAEAVTLADSLIAFGEGEVARWYFLKGWALAAQEKTPESLAALRQSQEAAADADSQAWAKSAGQLEGALERRDETDARLKEIWTKLHASLGEVGQLELRALVGAQGRPLVIHAFEREGEFLEVHLLREQRTVLAYRYDRGAGRLYLAEDGETRTFARGGLIPKPTLSLDAQGPTNMNANMEPEGGLVPALRQAVREGTLARLVERGTLVGSGAFPLLPAEATDGSGATVLRWIEPDPRSAEPDMAEVWISPEGRIMRASADRISLDSVRYGPAGAFEPALPPWPDAPERDVGAMDIAQLMRAFSDVIRLVMAEAPAQTMPGP